ncbi:MAG: M20/M25/M40 family metallo-hydrolase [Gammaproteobacteria bacterium]|nr:M20/M25/M40 family metallo-hydrolase [Gammaproteobacteria bacterium]
MDSERIGHYVAEVWDDSVVPTLEEYIRIPNKSPQFEPNWAELGYMQDAVEHLERWVSGYGIRGLEHRIVALPDRTPVLLCEVAGSAPGNVLLYGHYDKQPEFEGWVDGLAPWEPVIRDGRLYGRGGADDGYAVFGSIAAIAALQDQGVPHPRCIVLIEGCEESGSFDLPFYMDALADEIGTPDLVVCLDAECGNYDQLWLTTSLRGMLPGTLSVQVLTEGVHSGAAGGIVPSSFRLLRQLIERIENAVTGELVETLAVSIPDWARQQAEDVAATLGHLTIERFPWAGATNPGDASTADLVLANTWRSSLAVVGLGGAPALADAGNTLRPSTAAKLVFRLPPTLDAAAAGERVKALLEADPPQGAQVSFELEHPQTGWRAPDQAPWLTSALDRASRDHFGAPLRSMGCGGTIPFMKMLGDRYANVQFAVTGVLGPKSNAHGPNEFLDIATGKNVTACVAQLLGEAARRRA